MFNNLYKNKVNDLLKILIENGGESVYIELKKKIPTYSHI